MPNDLFDDEYAFDKMASLGQSQVFRMWDELTFEQKKHLATQIDSLDVGLLTKQQELLRAAATATEPIEPFSGWAEAGSSEDIQRGKQLIKQGHVGCLIVAGGQGTRLRIEGPKGMCPVTKIQHKTLFQLFAEKTLAASRQAQMPLPLAIMTSPQNHSATVAYFERNRYFGLNPSQVTFYKQGMLPLLNPSGNLFLDAPDSIAEGPDGNGRALHEFYSQGIWSAWHKLNVRFVNFILIDNPLADPFDANLAGYHAATGADVVIKAVRRSNADEKVGILAKQRGKAAVVEYTEIDEENRNAVDAEGRLRFPLANISLFSFSMDFIRSIVHTKAFDMPLHKAYKAVKYMDDEGRTVMAEQPMAWKFETFIFDVLSEASKVDALVYPREQCFAPLKNFSGQDSLETVPNALEESDRRTIARLTGIECLTSPLEIDQDFYYPTQELARLWQGRSVQRSGYVNATLSSYTEKD